MTRHTFHSRILLLLALLPLSALWAWLCVRTPDFGWVNLNSFGDGQRFSLGHHPRNWKDGFVFDIEKRQLEAVTNRLAAEPPRSGMGLNASFVSNTNKQWIIRLELSSQQRIVRAIERSFPVNSNFRFVAGRFIVSDAEGEIQWLDVEDPTETWHTFTNTPGQEVWLWVHPKLPVFRRTATKPIPPASTQLPQRFTELYRFDEQGQLTLLGSWPNAMSGKADLGDAWFQGETIATCDLSGKFLELRSLDNAQLVKTLELTPPIDLTTQKFRLFDDLLKVESGSGNRYYCISQERWLSSPWDEAQDGWTRASAELAPDSRGVLWCDRAAGAAVITDPATDSSICKLANVGERFQFLDASTLISIDSWFGLTIRRHDATTGATLLTWRPFWWVPLALTLAILGSAGWMATWLRMPQKNSLTAWADLHLLLFILMALIVLRLQAIGFVTDTMRMPYQHAIYLTSGFVFVAWAWLINGHGSVISRLSHWLIVYLIVLGALAQTLSTETNLAWMGAALVTIPSILALPVFLVARLRRWHWFDSQKQLDAVDGGSTQFISLRQIMLVTAIFALLSLLVRPIMPGVAGVLQLQWPIWEAAGITLCGLVALSLATANRRWLQQVAVGLAALVFLVFAVDALAMTIYVRPWKPVVWMQREIPVRHALGLYATVVCICSGLKRVDVSQ